MVHVFTIKYTRSLLAQYAVDCLHDLDMGHWTQTEVVNQSDLLVDLLHWLHGFPIELQLPQKNHRISPAKISLY